MQQLAVTHVETKFIKVRATPECIQSNLPSFLDACFCVLSSATLSIAAFAEPYTGG
jgi:hypothetical protein